MENKLNIDNFFFKIPSNISCLVKDNTLFFRTKKGEFKKFLIIYGQIKILENSIICLSLNKTINKNNKNELIKFSNFLKGVTKDFSITLKLNGIGYRVISNKKYFKIKIGLNKPFSIIIPENIRIRVINRVTFFIFSSDLVQLRNFVIKIRSIRFPDSYKAKGVQYWNEVFTLKEIRKVL